MLQSNGIVLNSICPRTDYSPHCTQSSFLGHLPYNNNLSINTMHISQLITNICHTTATYQHVNRARTQEKVMRAMTPHPQTKLYNHRRKFHLFFKFFIVLYCIFENLPHNIYTLDKCLMPIYHVDVVRMP